MAGAALALAAQGAAAQQPAAPAAPLTPALLAQVRALATSAAQALAPAGARIDVEVGALDSRLALAPCGRVDAYLAAGVPSLGKSRVGLRCADGSARWNVALPVTVHAWAPAWTAAAALPAGVRLTAAQLVQADTDWGAAPQPPIAEAAQIEGRTLLRPLAAGQALRPADLQPRVWFAAGDTVQVVARGSGFEISAEGQAMSPGVEGQRVRVRMDGSDAPPVVGRAAGGRRVELDR